VTYGREPGAKCTTLQLETTAAVMCRMCGVPRMTTFFFLSSPGAATLPRGAAVTGRWRVSFFSKAAQKENKPTHSSAGGCTREVCTRNNMPVNCGSNARKLTWVPSLESVAAGLNYQVCQGWDDFSTGSTVCLLESCPTPILQSRTARPKVA
jgi:hypothetical protein